MCDTTNPEDESMAIISRRSNMSSGLTGLQPVSARKKELSRQLRKNGTKAEDVFWEAVRNRKCGGLKFRRQQVIARYIADFYCEEVKLVVEIDGSIHENEDVKKNDEKKNAAYTERGLYTLRFTNNEVFELLEYCLGKVKVIAELRMC
jgi:very-short-patch-repair endonuclease